MYVNSMPVAFPWLCEFVRDITFQGIIFLVDHFNYGRFPGSH